MQKLQIYNLIYIGTCLSGIIPEFQHLALHVACYYLDFIIRESSDPVTRIRVSICSERKPPKTSCKVSWSSSIMMLTFRVASLVAQ